MFRITRSGRKLPEKFASLQKGKSQTRGDRENTVHFIASLFSIHVFTQPFCTSRM